MLGHSLGGAVALALASGWFGVRVSAVCGLGIKVAWTDEERARGQALSARPNPVYATRREAAERHLRLAGLTGLVAPDAVGEAALVRDAGGWTVAFDPALFAVSAPDMAGLLGASRAAVTLAAGEHDPMCTEEQLRKLVPDPVILPGLGHNAHAQAPEALWPLLERLTESAPRRCVASPDVPVSDSSRVARTTARQAAPAPRQSPMGCCRLGRFPKAKIRAGSAAV